MHYLVRVSIRKLPGTGIDPETSAVHYVLWVLCGDDLFVQTRGRGNSSKVKLKVKPAGVWQSKLDLRAWVINQLKHAKYRLRLLQLLDREERER
jgi:hypothetical protein